MPEIYTVKKKREYYEIKNPEGPVLGMKELKIKEKDGLAFKNLSGQEELLPYEDWRLGAEERAKDLASRISVEEIAGLMLYSPHQMVPFRPGSPFVGHYDGKDYADGRVEPWSLTDEQKRFLQEEHIRNVLLNHFEDGKTTARWVNELQSVAEQQPWGIPVSISSDPRHAAAGKAAEFSSEGKDVSRWPEGIGLAATFSPELVKEFAQIASKEYRALGITMALGPQIDLATEPRWMRYEDTMGGNQELLIALTRAYCDGMQTTEDREDGWGKDSVAAMVKHWPGGGTGEGGRDAHYPFGKFGVFPGGQMEEHMKVFTEGAFQLEGKTEKASAVMPYYTISWDQDKVYGENLGNAYSRYLIQDRLRREAGFDGVICTDWQVTGTAPEKIDSFGKRCHGVENLTEAEQHFKILMNDVDQFGGNDRKEPILQAYRMGCEQYGEAFMRQRMEKSAVRILKILFRLGLFENPYLDSEKSAKIVGGRSFVEAGLEAQRRSVVLLKNKDRVLPLKRGIRLYVPECKIGTRKNFLRSRDPEKEICPLTPEEAEGWFMLTKDSKEADAALVFMESPLTDGGYSEQDLEAGGNGYVPITLQYRPYQAKHARKTSIAFGDFREPDMDRGYFGKTGICCNEQELDNLLETREKMGDKPVIVCLRIHNPSVVAEFEPFTDGILAEFGVEKKVLLDILCGEKQPGGRLPMILPESMETVERHCEDVFDDIRAYRDSCGNTYGFGFGLKM